MIIDSLYVGVKDMDRAIKFYTKLFQKKPEHIEKRYSLFLVGDISYGLYSPSTDGEKLKIGNNCVIGSGSIIKTNIPDNQLIRN